MQQNRDTEQVWSVWLPRFECLGKIRLKKKRKKTCIKQRKDWTNNELKWKYLDNTYMINILHNQNWNKGWIYLHEWIKYPLWAFKGCRILTCGVTFCPQVQCENLHSSVPLQFMHKWLHGHRHQLSSWGFFTSSSHSTFVAAKCIRLVWSTLWFIIS